MLKNELENSIKKSAKELQKKYKLRKISEFSIERPKDFRFGDLATNAAMVLAKDFKKSPAEIGNFLIKKIKKNKDFYPAVFKKIEIIKPGFINFTFSEQFVQNNLLEILKEKENFGRQKIGRGKTVVIDYSHPNIAKEMSVAHLRSTIIGQALANIYKFLGYKTIRDNHLGDWGTQFGKLIYAYKNWSGKNFKNISLADLEKLYVRFHKESAEDPKLEEKARQETKKLQEGDKENLLLWKKFKEISLNEFKNTYKILDVKFDYFLGESFYQPWLKSLVNSALKKKIARVSEGAVIIDLGKYNLPPFLIQKADGAFLYSTTDLAAIKYRREKFKPEKIFYVVANEQSLYFEQLFQSSELLGLFPKEKLVHIKFGMVLGKDRKKLSTRKGGAVHLKDLIEKSISLAQKIVEEKNPELSEKEKNKIAELVGVGAMKYNDLSQNRLTDIIFDWEKMLNLQGDSAPYLQYTYARIQSIFRKSDYKFSNKFDLALLKDELELSILKQLLFFPETIQRAAEECLPNIIADYLYQLAERFNLFYQKIPVLKTEKELRSARLNLIFAVALVLKNGLELLRIKTPEKM